LLQETIKKTEVVIAAINEEKGIGLTISEMSRYLRSNRIVVVDGRSEDRTVEVAKDLGAEILLQSGIGKGDAMFKALTSLDPTVDYIVFTDADYTYPAEHVPSMLELLEQNPSVGMVCGNRINGEVNSKALHPQFYVGNKMLALAHNLLNGVDLEDPLTGLRVVRAEILRNWKQQSKGFDVEVELNDMVKKQGYSIVEIPIYYRERIGEKKLKIKHGAVILRRIIMQTLR